MQVEEARTIKLNTEKVLKVMGQIKIITQESKIKINHQLN